LVQQKARADSRTTVCIVQFAAATAAAAAAAIAAALAAAMGETQRKAVNGMPRNDVSMTDMSGLDNDPKVHSCSSYMLNSNV
jgi:hypothetical protein